MYGIECKSYMFWFMKSTSNILVLRFVGLVWFVDESLHTLYTCELSDEYISSKSVLLLKYQFYSNF